MLTKKKCVSLLGRGMIKVSLNCRHVTDRGNFLSFHMYKEKRPRLTYTKATYRMTVSQSINQTNNHRSIDQAINHLITQVS